MADKDVKVKITTEADTKGAKQAGDDLQKVGDKAKAGSQAAAGSLQALEDELEELQRELRRLPVGGDEFMALSRKIKVAESNLVQAEQAARKLGATMGRRGNAGMAVLEFSRAFEDAQYGIRGVLNNIPGLIAQLGGGAGLAGAISIAAVAATQLWERMGSGAKAAKDPLDAYKKSFDEAKSALEDLESESQRQRDDASNQIAKNASDQLKSLDMRAWYAQQQDSLATLEIKAKARLQILKNESEIARIDAEARTANGQKAVDLARKRLALTQTNKEIEQQTTEELRKQDVIIAQRKADDAKARSEVARGVMDAAAESRNPLLDFVTKSEEERSRIYELLRKAQEDLAERAEKNSGNFTANAFGADVVSASELINAEEVKALRQSIEGFKGQIGNIDGQIKIAEGYLEKETEKFESAAQKWNEALDELVKSQDSVKVLEKKQEIDRSVEAGEAAKQANVDSLALKEDLRTSGQEAAAKLSAALETILAGIANAADNPNVRSQADRIKEILSDGLQSGEQEEVTSLMKMLVGQMNVGFTDQRNTLQSILALIDSAISTLRDMDQRIKAHEANLRSLNSQQGKSNW